MKKIYTLIRGGLALCACLLLALSLKAQDCNTLNFTHSTTESRCIATGSITVQVTGGSGNYNYKVTGPVSTPYTSSNTISGLSAGSYTVIVKDISLGCTVQHANIVVAGTYSDPRFVLSKTDVTCTNGNDGTVTVSTRQFGLAPFTYTIVAPSPAGVGTSNTSGIFTGLPAGEYVIQLKDSCGGQQTRRVTVLNYNWWIDGVTIQRVLCDSAEVSIHIKDSKGNTSGSIFNGFQYAVVRTPGDTIWSNTPDFRFFLGSNRSVRVVIKDPCGNTQVYNWTDPQVPSIAANVTISNQACSTFTATVTGQTNLTNPHYYLFDGAVLIDQNTTGIFNNVVNGSYCIQVIDACYDTTITRCFTASQPVPVADASVIVTNKTCNGFNVTINGSNLTNPHYYLYTSTHVLGSDNIIGTFANIPYGSYCIEIENDGCYDTTISRCFTVAPDVPVIADTIATSVLGCTTFTATITGQSNLNNPQFCLYDAGNNLITCNGTGVFPNLTYGAWCVKMQNDAGCYDTLITRCVTLNRPIPGAGADVTINNRTCSTFTASVAGAVNLNGANYCLYDAANVQITCNGDGIFPGLSYGQYCIRIYNNASCYDTTIERCFNATPPVSSVAASVSVSNKACSTVKATVGAITNLTNAVYELLNVDSSFVMTGTNGVFNNVPYGTYLVKITNACYDTIIWRKFTAARNIPTGGSVSITNRVCTGFRATLAGYTNLITPQYRLYDAGNTEVANNTNGIFNDLPYGSYTLRIYDPCYDTTITRTFTGTPVPLGVTIGAVKSCTIGTTDITATIATGNAPYHVQVFGPFGNLLRNVVSATSPVLVSGLPGLPPGLQYKVKAIDNCNVADSAMVTPVASILNKTRNATTKCPTAQWENGATDIDIDVTSNMGTVVPAIVAKDGATVNISYSHNLGSNYKFIDLEPATYVVAYTIPGCTNKVYDTVVVEPYGFPGLQKSAAYQCNNNSFSVGASVTGGCSPFTYEVIGSLPGAPSLITGAQGNPVFNINNGTEYSLIRLRAVDACGNATLNDVNILPLANAIVNASSNCFYNDITLQVDSIPNATYQWFRKTTEVDSTLMGSGLEYNIPYLMPADTGVYVCKMSVNGGCLTQLSYFMLDGMCGGMLPGQVVLAGKPVNGKVQLSWAASDDAGAYIIERSNSKDGIYTSIGTVKARQDGRNLYVFMDNNPLSGANYYRLRVADAANRITYTNIVLVRMQPGTAVSLYPNPVAGQLNIDLWAKEKQTWRIVIYNAAGQMVYQTKTAPMQQGIVPYHRSSSIRAGMYMVQVTAIETGEMKMFKVFFE